MKLISSIVRFYQHGEANTDLSKDAIAFFTGKVQGHMEKWEYGPSLFPDDPAGGSAYWAELIKHPGAYYPPQEDTKAIAWAVKQPQLKNLLANVQTVTELGPGSHEAILKKTLPFIKACPQIKTYIAIDATLEQAADAAQYIERETGIETEILEQDFLNSPLVRLGASRKALIMWGGAICNINGHERSDPYPKLVSTFESFKDGLDKGDLIVIAFDTQTDREIVLKAYNEPVLSQKFLSILHRIRRETPLKGQFDPHAWRHESVWFPEVGQCAHMLYPTVEQVFSIGKQKITVQAGQRVISNNSYKMPAATFGKAATDAGLINTFCLQNGPAAVFVGEKP